MNRLIPLAAVLFGLAACGEAPGDKTASTPSTTGSPATTSTTDTTIHHPDRSPNADNSGVNKGDGKDALTPLSQGSSTEDTHETQIVRKAIVADHSLSVDAQNIKIITVNGTLTLRGTVDSKSEHERVCQIAKDTIGSPVFDDQLNVKTTTP